MERKRWIVVGTDFTPRGEQALAHAIDVATQTGSSIALVHAYDDSFDSAADVAAELETNLERAITGSGAARRGVHVEPLLRRGTAWEKLHNVATDIGADLIVIGARAGALTTRAITASKRSVLVIALHDQRTTEES